MTKAPISPSRAAIASAQRSSAAAGVSSPSLDAAGEVERRKHQALPSIMATIRRVARCAIGMTRKAVVAATGQAMT